jgi:hypothetical protein
MRPLRYRLRRHVHLFCVAACQTPIPISVHCMRPLRDRLRRHVHHFCAAACQTPSPYASASNANDLCLFPSDPAMSVFRFLQFMYIMGLHKAKPGQEKKRRPSKKAARGRKRTYSAVALEVRCPYLLLLRCTTGCALLSQMLWLKWSSIADSSPHRRGLCSVWYAYEYT